MSSWECRYLKDDYCRRLKKNCVPGCKGCVLYGKVIFADEQLKKNNNKKKRKGQ